jgi:hypothetical protein
MDGWPVVLCAHTERPPFRSVPNAARVLRVARVHEQSTLSEAEFFAAAGFDDIL